MPLSLFTVGSILSEMADRACDRASGLGNSPGARQRTADAHSAQSAEYSFFSAHPDLFEPVAVARDIRREREGTLR